MKKQVGFGSKTYYDRYGLGKEFVRMSRMPGIGKGYFDKHFETIYRDDEILVPTNKGVRAFKPPPYFDDLYEKINPEHLAEVKLKRENYVKKQIELYGFELEKTARDADTLRTKTNFTRDFDI